MKMKKRLLALALALTLVWSSLPVTALADSAPAPAPMETAVEAPAEPEPEQPEAPAAPEVSAAPEPTAEPPETPAPEPSPTASPDPTPTPEPSASPVPPATPAPTASPEPTASPDPAPLAANGVLRASSPTQTEDSVASVTKGEATTYYDSLDDALDAVANADATVKLLKDAKIDNSYSFYGDVTIEGGGYTVEGYGVWTSWQGKLTLRNIQSPDLSVYAFYGGTVLIEGDSSVDLATTFGGSITLTSGRVSTFYIMGESSTATVNGGTIEYLLNEGTVTVTGGTIEVMGNEGTITVLPTAEDQLAVNLSAAIVAVDASVNASVVVNNPNVTLPAGFTPAAPSVTWSSSNEEVATVDENGTVTGVSEGTATITAKLTVEGTEYEVAVSVTVVTAGTVALVTTGGTTTSCSNFDDALNAVENAGGAVTLLQDVETSRNHDFNANVTIDGGNHSVSANPTWCTWDVYSEITLQNIVVNLDVFAYSSAQMQIENSSMADLYVCENASVCIKGGKVSSLSNDNSGTVTLTGGTITSLNNFDSGTVKITSGTISELNNRDTGTATVTGGEITYLYNKKDGTVTVTAGTISDVSGTITVLPTAADQLSVSPSPLSVAVGATVNASVVVNNDDVTLPDGFTPDAPSVSWLSRDPSIAAIDTDGTVSGLKVGTATIAAIYDTPEGGTFTATAEVTVQYPAPSPGIDYKNEQLTGLVENTTYKISVDGTANTYTADGNGYIKIQEGWFGKTLTIVRMEGTEAASLAGSKEIPARPAAPGAKGQNVTASGWTDGKITGLDAGKTYEYSTDKTNWKAVDLGATEITRLPEDTYYLRYPATDAAFASAVQTITIGSNAPTYIVTIPETIAVNGEAVAVSASNVCLPAGGKLQVAITGSGDNGAFLLSDGKTDTVEYAVTCDDQPVTPGGTILTVEPGGGNPQEPQSAVANLAFTLPRGAEPAYAGTYSGHVTFTVTTTP